MKTLAQALAGAIAALSDVSESPRLDAQLLLSHVLRKPFAWLIAHDGEALGASEQRAFDIACEQRAAGKPIAYILGTAGFARYEFLVNEHVLVPRPETEHLVDEAVAYVRPMRDARLLDVGTGSGAIACTIALEVPQAHVDAVDVSGDALAVARANARRLRVADRVTFYESDLLAALPAHQPYDVVVANLPYVPTADIAPAPAAVSFEPRLALDGGPDGLDVYRRLLPSLPARLRPGGLVLLEAAAPLMDALVALARDVFAKAAVGTRGDYAARERYVYVRLTGDQSTDPE